MNKKSQLIGFIIMVGIFVAFWFIWLGGWLSEVGQRAIIDGSLTGIEAFLYANLNLWVFIGLVLGIMGYMYFGGGA